MHETSLMKLLWFGVTNRPDEARKYATTIFQKGADLAPLRDEFSKRLSPPIYDALMAAMPWLGEETFGKAKSQPIRLDTPVPPRDRILLLLEQAGSTGRRQSDMRPRFADKGAFDAAIEALSEEGRIVGRQIGSGGRPAMTYWLAEMSDYKVAEDGALVFNPDPFAVAQDIARKARAIV